MNTAKMVLNQTTIYNGHGQMEVSEMSLKKALKICRQMENLYTGAGEPRFILEVWSDYTAYIYQVNGIESGKNKLWLSIDNFTV